MTADALPAGAPKTIDLMAALQASLRREDPVAASQVEPAGAPTPTDETANRLAELEQLLRDMFGVEDELAKAEARVAELETELAGLRSRQTRDEDGQRASVAYAHIAPPITAEDLDFVAAHIPDAWGRPLTRAQFDAERERLATVVSALRSHFFPTATLTTSQSGALSSSSGQGAE